jgi:uncharacterized damage-inducible protein DinB
MNEHHEFIAKIEHLPPKVEAAVRGLNDAQLDTPTGEGKWSIRQLVHHIADANMNAFIRMKLVASEEKPILKPYDQDRWMAQADGVSCPVESSLQLLNGLHPRWAMFLKSLPESAWTREGIHLENGKVTLEAILKLYSNHGETHLQHILNFKQKMHW